MKKKFKLEFFSQPDFVVYGISSPLKEYKLVYHMNNIKGIKFKRIADFPGHNGVKSNEAIPFPLFRFKSTENDYSLVSVKTPEGILLPYLKQPDFLLLVSGTHNPDELQLFLKAIRAITNVIMVFEINVLFNPNFPVFLNDMELHLISSDTDVKNFR